VDTKHAPPRRQGGPDPDLHAARGLALLRRPRRPSDRALHRIEPPEGAGPGLAPPHAA